ncbi:peptide deformylase [Fodinicurvata sp. EGI_FJ10296]|uniref:peptide deformylase n=1 Tax=Fodinicurvata sp. EGI_FJ10296 TaxID=3231908 RepID=UPI0034527CD1
MAIHEIRLIPDPALKQACQPVSEIDDGILRLMDDMLDTMYDAPGIGLAAPQIGVFKRVVVMDVAEKGADPAPMRLINPEILWTSEDLVTTQEGCLSVPEQYADVTRPAQVRIAYLDETGTRRELEGDGILSVCIQHEIDHLDGVLFTDHLSTLKRNMIMRKVAKWKKGRAA